ncbi:MAG TPA: EAL domain-containing protein, partial [Polyangiales bacterium]|nr:EAL domain-containing protein [Polyangiales bacterium]
MTGRITGGEALIRWRKQDGSLVPPGLFIPLAEETGFISEITLRMFPVLLDDYQRIREVTDDGHVAFNVSASDLEQEELVVAMERAIEQGRISGKNLRVEVTEAAALSSSPRMREWVQRFVKLGVELALDDFGTGYSSLDAIRKLPFSTLKVDQGIVREMQRSERAAMLVHANVLLAQVLGMEAVAEGIETEPIYRALMHSGCREGQGYWMSRPLPLDDYLALLRSGRTWPASHAGLLRTVLMSHVIELRRVMDWVYAARSVARGASSAPGTAPPSLVPPAEVRSHAFSKWYEGDGKALSGNRAFEAMRVPNMILTETYELIQARASSGANPQELEDQLKKLAHYSVVLIGDLLGLESQL